MLGVNLEILGLPVQLDKQSFIHPQAPALIDHLLYFLFTKYSPKETTKRFHGAWPVLEHIGNRDFRFVAFHWIKELHESGLLPKNLPIRRSFIDQGYGERFAAIMAWLSVLSLRSELCRFKPRLDLSLLDSFQENQEKNETSLQSFLSANREAFLILTYKLLSKVSLLEILVSRMPRCYPRSGVFDGIWAKQPFLSLRPHQDIVAALGFLEEGLRAHACEQHMARKNELTKLKDCLMQLSRRRAELQERAIGVALFKSIQLEDMSFDRQADEDMPNLHSDVEISFLEIDADMDYLVK